MKLARTIRSGTALLACALASLAMGAQARPTANSPLASPPDGMTRQVAPRAALVGATVHVRPGEQMEDAVVLIEHGEIRRVVPRAEYDRMARPGGTIEVDYTGRHIYAGFIEAYLPVRAPGVDSSAVGAHWNEGVTPHRRALDGSAPNARDRDNLRKMGFTAAHLVPDQGVFRGRTALISLADPRSDSSHEPPAVYRDGFADAVAFERNTRRGGYPSSHMGAVALIRQVLADADWQRRTRQTGDFTGGPDAIDELADANRPLFFDIEREMTTLHAADIASEFKRNAIIVGNGMEFKWLEAIAAENLPVIVPLRFPRAPDVSGFGEADSTDLERLMEWEQAPTNPRRLAEAGVKTAITSAKRIRGAGNLHNDLRSAVRHGLSADDALAMLTTNPAEILGAADRLGSVERGRRANLVVTDRPLFVGPSRILDVWTEGERHVIATDDVGAMAGVYEVNFRGEPRGTLTITRRPRVTLEDGDVKTRAEKVSIDGDRLSYTVKEHDGSVAIATAQRRGTTLHGTLMIPDGRTFSWTAVRVGDAPDDERDREERGPGEIPDLKGYPFGPYAVEEKPQQRRAIFTNATIWTASEAGTIENGVLAIDGGKIAFVGTRSAFNRSAASRWNNAERFDLEGRHIAPGFVDAHSHTGTFALGVNEGTQAVTSEVRIADAVDSSHINWYRQLAGGVTTVNTLHGSANPIGGQSLTQKVRWGSRHPRDMHMDGATPGIKFALGENVKQSNWGDTATTRYPQTRMGVETIMRDRFHAAQRYEEERRRGGRRNLELEALAEVLRGDRLIHCHSYRQDEILMLCLLAKEFGITIGTFQHGLEVYKVAEAVREAAIGASIFSDWWNFKVEVWDAIPYAGPLQHEVGVNTSFNSDSDELARRMHAEGAKAVKYSGGRVSPEEAIKFVTINAAVQLGIGDRVGSLEAGKDADFVIWSGSPLSTLSRAESTWIDGAEYFSLEMDREHRKRIASERRRLIQKILAGPPSEREEKKDEEQEKKEEAETPDPDRSLRARMLAQERALVRERMLEALNANRDPTLDSCGVCGCSEFHFIKQTFGN
ncbi:MAG: amidohydrolase family protein [Phycisphaerales bacterium]|nr:amidohydrolase family protein [Phycisphaerales bacterium]